MAEYADDAAEPLTVLSSRLLRELSRPTSLLHATVERSDGAVVMHVGGEIDACNEALWRRLLGEVVSATPRGAILTIDLAGLRFISCGALEVIVRHAQRGQRRHIDMRLVTEQAVIRQIIGDRALRGAPTVYATLEQAMGFAPHRARVARPAESRWIATMFDQIRRRRDRPSHVGYTIVEPATLAASLPDRAVAAYDGVPVRA